MIWYIQAKDAKVEGILATCLPHDNRPLPKRFFKASTRETRELIKRQLSHIDKGCLSDPDPSLVNIYRRNSSTDKTYLARGTNTCERDNFDIAHRILTATHIGKFNLVQQGLMIQ